MNERRAEEMGYSFHGAYSHDKEEMKLRAKELRDSGNKAVVVNIPPNPLSRGHHGMGYSVYWIESSKNAEARRKAQIEDYKLSLKLERKKLVERLSEIDNILLIHGEKND